MNSNNNVDINVFLYAVYGVESSFGKNININKEDKFTSLGPLQITRILVDDVNRILTLKKSNIYYSYNDRLDLNKSNNIALVYLNYYVNIYNIPYTYVNLSRIWNGGPKAYLIQNNKQKENNLQLYTSKIMDIINENINNIKLL